MGWPTPDQYHEAIQTAVAVFRDADLRDGVYRTNRFGLPVGISGRFAIVYQCSARSGRSFALRCFQSQGDGLPRRYHAVSEFLKTQLRAATVKFDYLTDELRIGAARYPVLKMEWVSGRTLGEFVRENLSNASQLRWVGEQFLVLVDALASAGAAHGDLQHDNIMVTSAGLKLVDYDGMYVPSLRGDKAIEVGHRNYQHPKRGLDDFGPELNRFSTWAIYLSLLALREDVTLWTTLGGGDDCLLFKREDFERPGSSLAFKTLRTHRNAQVAHLANELLAQLARPPLAVAALSGALQSLRGAPPTTTNGPLPDWMDKDNIAQLPMGTWSPPNAPRAPSAPSQPVLPVLAPPKPSTPITPLVPPGWIAPAVPAIHPMSAAVPPSRATQVGTLLIASALLLLSVTHVSASAVLSGGAAGIVALFVAVQIHQRRDSAQVQNRGAMRTINANIAVLEAHAARRSTLEVQLARIPDELRQTIERESRRAYEEEVERRLASTMNGPRDVPNVGPKTIDNLRAMGWGSAWSLRRGGVEQVYGVGPQRAANLRDWALAHEERIRASTPRTLPQWRDAQLRAQASQRTSDANRELAAVPPRPAVEHALEAQRVARIDCARNLRSALAYVVRTPALLVSLLILVASLGLVPTWSHRPARALPQPASVAVQQPVETPPVVATVAAPTEAPALVTSTPVKPKARPSKPKESKAAEPTAASPSIAAVEPEAAGGDTEPATEPDGHARAHDLNVAGLKAAKAGDHSEAHRLYQLAIEADPNAVWPRYNAACELALAGQGQRALAQLETIQLIGGSEAMKALRSVARDSDFASVRHNARLARLLESVGIVDDANNTAPAEVRADKPVAVVAAEVQPKRVVSVNDQVAPSSDSKPAAKSELSAMYRKRGLADFQNGKLESAKHLLQMAVASDPDDVVAATYLAKVRAALGEADAH